MGEGHVFVSYSSADRGFADELVRALELNGLKIWFAPRDVRPGLDYSEQIQAAIESSKAFVIIISEASNESDFVRAETEMAFSRRRPIYPVRAGPTAPAPGLALFLQLRHWTDAFGTGAATAIARLGGELAVLVPRGNAKARRAGQSILRRLGPRSGPGARPVAKGRRRAMLAMTIIGCAALILSIALLFQSGARSDAQAGNGQAAPVNAVAAAPAPGQPDYGPVVQDWIPDEPETPPPPDENLTMVGNAATDARAADNAADAGKNVNGM